MAGDSMRVRLPETELGADRNFRMAFNFHGDIHLAFWNGELGSDEENMPSQTRAFGMAHGNELPLLASLAGYYARCGVDGAQIRRDFAEAGNSVLAEDIPPRLGGFGLRNAARIADGSGSPRFSIESLGWNCLLTPVPSQPGVVEEVGGTGIYTKATQLGGLALIFARIQPGAGKTDAERVDPGSVVELGQPDVLPMVRIICDLSMGEYRQEISTFLQTKLPEA